MLFVQVEKKLGADTMSINTIIFDLDDTLLWDKKICKNSI